MRRLRRLVHLVLLCPFSKGLQVSGSRPGAATRGGAGRGTARVDGCTRAHRSPFFPLLLQKKNSGIANLGHIQPLASP